MLFRALGAVVLTIVDATVCLDYECQVEKSLRHRDYLQLYNIVKAPVSNVLLNTFL